MATLSVQTISRTGLKPAYVACNVAGDKFANDGDTFIHIKNGHSSAQTVTIETAVTVDGLAVADRTVGVTEGEERMIGPFSASAYNGGDGLVQLTYDGVTLLTIAVIHLGT